MDSVAALAVLLVTVITAMWSILFDTYDRWGLLAAVCAGPVLGVAGATITGQLRKPELVRWMVWCSLLVFLFTVFVTIGARI